MDSKKRQASDTRGSAKKQKQAISMETKVTIIKKLESGEKMVNVACMFNINRFTVGTIYNSKDRITEHVKVQCLCSLPLSARNGVS